MNKQKLNGVRKRGLLLKVYCEYGLNALLVIMGILGCRLYLCT